MGSTMKSKKFFYTWEDIDEKNAETMIADIIADPELRQLEEVIIGCWGESWDNGAQAIIDGIVMKTGGSSFVLETGVIKEFVRVTEEMMIHEPNGDEYIMIRGDCFPVLRLGEWYGMSDYESSVEEGIMLILEVEDKKICLFVDKLIGEQEIVVKPIPSYIKKVKGLSGCTQLGDGSIALILDPAGLVE